MAGFIGALAEIKENIIVTGSAYEQGSCFPSSLHINGEAIDTLYFSKSTDSKKRQKELLAHLDHTKIQHQKPYK